MEPSDCPRCLIRSCVYFKPSLLTIHLKTDRSSWLNCAGLEVYIYIIRTITLLFAPLSAHLCPPSPEIKHSTCTFTCCSSVFCHKYTHTPTHGCEAHVLSATNRNRGVRPTSTTLWHHHRACSLILQPQSPGISPPHPVIEQPHRLAAVSVNAAPSVKQPLGNVNTHRERGGERFSSFLHLQRMTVHDSGVFQRLKTWPSGMHHSISTVSSSMGLNSGVNHGDHLSRGGETGWRQPH